MNPPDCDKCKFWQGDESGQVGLCRAHPPKSEVFAIEGSPGQFQILTHYPELKARGDGCFEFSPLPNQEEPSNG